MKIIFTYIILLVIGVSAMNAQETFQPKQLETEMKGILYKKENNATVRLHTYGFALGYMNGRIKSYSKTDYYTIELGFMKHPQQYRQPLQAINTGNAPTNPYYYGKINNFMQVRAGYKKRNYLSEKSKVNGIAVGFSYEIAGVLGIEKPYHLTVRDFNDGPGNPLYQVRSITYDEDPILFLDKSQILGSDKFFRGLGQSKFVPGLSVRADVVFAWGAYDKFSRSLEAGIMLDLYPRKIEIMANEQNSSLFLNAYINFVFGSRK